MQHRRLLHWEPGRVSRQHSSLNIFGDLTALVVGNPAVMHVSLQFICHLQNEKIEVGHFRGLISKSCVHLHMLVCPLRGFTYVV